MGTDHNEVRAPGSWCIPPFAAKLLIKMLKHSNLRDLRARQGQDLGVSDWQDVTQDAVEAFADVTGDHQWIHIDPDRAAGTPAGGTVAHGYYTLSLAPALLAELLPLDGFAMAVNYGLDKLRFPAPLPVGDRVRMAARLDRVEDVPGGATLFVTLTFERAGGDKPVCVAQALYRVVEEQQ